MEVEYLCFSLTNLPTRTSLRYSDFGPEGARALAEMLRTNRTLTELK